MNDIPDASVYEEQTLVGVPTSPIFGALEDPEKGFQYIEMRDGALLSAMIRFPDPALYGEAPYPTVVIYSGYSPSRSDRQDTGSLIANMLGYATVSVNMRGTGCSGGVFDVFNRAQHADGYDIVETVARQGPGAKQSSGHGWAVLSRDHRNRWLYQSTITGSNRTVVHYCRPWEMQW